MNGAERMWELANKAVRQEQEAFQKEVGPLLAVVLGAIEEAAKAGRYNVKTGVSLAKNARAQKYVIDYLHREGFAAQMEEGLLIVDWYSPIKPKNVRPVDT